MGARLNADLVFLTLGGVQPFIAESRKTADAAGASLTVRHVVAAAAKRPAALEAPFGLVMPAPSVLTEQHNDVPVGISNKIVFLAPPGTGPEIAARATADARAEWDRLVREAHGKTVSTPGMPDLTWACATGEFGSDAEYRELWKAAEAAMRQRKRTRWFTPHRSTGMTLCDQSPLLPAIGVPRGQEAMKVPSHERKERLSAAGWTKRSVGNTIYGKGRRFAATTVVASSWFRAKLLERAATDPELRRELVPLVEHLARISPNKPDHASIPGEHPAELEALSSKVGSTISPDAWEPHALPHDVRENAAAGRRLASQIGRLAQQHELPSLTPYFAIVVQDLDKLGATISDLSLADQRNASRVLTDLGGRQRELSRHAEHLGVPVFAGGDDFLAFAPAATALRLASAIRRSTAEHLRDEPSLSHVTASTAVVFSHMTSPLREAIAAAQQALDQAKEAHGRGISAQRNALSVVVRRRGGERARTIQPWYHHDHDAAELLGSAAPDAQFSAKLASRLEHDRDELARLAGADDGLIRDVARAEVRRLVERQGGTPDVADAVIELGEHERRADGTSSRFDPVPAALVARFLAQECR
ncbi:Cas10/Cmr2 second palm domain-containing protein [Saccharopolyspora flava]|uniref:CRISPR-associated protein Cmr2 n=1 Tax=Saccharopolyspora flava TaxID=95161 RepID=A0A1I6UK07_9PSEU|nr:hypothetical protein [Saccharopolyspora flava]SFT01782.1 CRISPR-associated protein Cmr2 [Saccharopolyspora flava]